MSHPPTPISSLDHPFAPPDAPPAYSASPVTLVRNQVADDQWPRSSRVLPKPCVVPQTSHTIHGSIYRPFARAYPPYLETLSISRTDFLAFLDGLNEAWLAHPYLQAVSMSGNLLGFLPLLETQIAGLGVTVAAEYGSVKLSQARTQAYMKMANEQFFAPKGLRVQVLKTKAMMAEVRIPGEVLDLGGTVGVGAKADRDEEFADLEEKSRAGSVSSVSKGEKDKKTKTTGKDGDDEVKTKYDPQLRRLDAIQDYVQPLVFDTERTAAENWVKKAAQKQERWFSQKQNKAIVGRRDKAAKIVSQAEAAERELALEMETLQAQKASAQERARERLQGPLGESMQGQLIVQEDLEKEVKKLDKKLAKLEKEREKKVTKRLGSSEKRINKIEKKESRIAQKVMWVVITPLGDEQWAGFHNHLYEDEDDE